jgi:hypothetical protein
LPVKDLDEESKMRGKPQVKNDNSSSGTSIILDGLSLMQRGNEYFFSDCYLEATGYYYQAAMLLKTSPEHKKERSKAWSNVAECHLRLQNWQAAEDAATNAINADKTNVKALFRRAKARFELSDYAGAAKDADAVGTQDAMDVAALCRELAHAEVARKLATGGTRERREKRERRQPASCEVRDPPPPSIQEMEERELWFRRIIDSYRLRVDDEYVQTGASDAGCLYGIQAKGLEAVKSPMDHFQAYVNRAIKKRVLPEWFTVSDMEELCVLASNDSFSNIHCGVLPEDIVEYYNERMGSHHNELQELRDLAVYIEGPIGMPWKKDHNPAPPPPPEPKKPAMNRSNVVLEGGAKMRSSSWGNAYMNSAPAPAPAPTPTQHKQVYDLSERYSFGRRAYPSPTKKLVPSNNQVPYLPMEKHGQQMIYNQKHHRQSAPTSPRRTGPLPTAPSNDTRNPRYFDSRRKEPKHHEQHHQGPQHRNGSYSPRGKKSHAKPGNRYGLMFSEEKRAPSPSPVTETESTLSDEYLSYGPQLPYNPSATPGRSFGPQLPYNPSGIPGIRIQHSARKMMMSLMPSMESDDERDIYERKNARQETSTSREVRHGLWRGDHRDEFSELTESSP